MHEFSADLSSQDRFKGRLQGGPVFESAVRPRPQHAMHPVQYMRRIAFDQRARGRIGPELVKLAPQPEIAIGRPPAEQIGTRREMSLKERKECLDNLDKKRQELTKKAVELDKQRSDYIAKKEAEDAKTGKNSFDAQVLEVLRKQAKKNKIDY